MSRPKKYVRWRLERPSGLGAEATFHSSVGERKVRKYLSGLLYLGLDPKPVEELELKVVLPREEPEEVCKVNRKKEK